MLKKIKTLSLLTLFFCLFTSSLVTYAQEKVEDWFGSYEVEGSIVKGITIEEDHFTIYYKDTKPEDFAEDPLVNEIYDWINRENHLGGLVDPTEDFDPEEIETSVAFFVDLEEENPLFPEADREIVVHKPEYRIIDGRLNVYAYKENLHFFSFDEESGHITFQPIKGEALTFKKLEEKAEE